MTLNNIGADVYVSKHSTSDPSPFSYDMSFLNVTSINLASVDLLLNSTDGYTVAMYVNAIDEANNNLLNSTITVKFSANEAATLFMTGLAATILATL